MGRYWSIKRFPQMAMERLCGEGDCDAVQRECNVVGGECDGKVTHYPRCLTSNRSCTMLFPALTAAFGLFGTILSAVAIGLPNWSRFEYLTATSENTIGLWTLPDNTYCQGWVIATAAMMICALICFFLVLFGAALILCSKVAWKTRSLRILVCPLALRRAVFSGVFFR